MSMSETASAVASAPRLFGGHSMVDPLRRVMVRRPAPPLGADQWRDFGFLHPVDHSLSARQHEAFTDLLTGAGVDVIVEETDDAGALDAIFAYDPSYITDAGAILLRMGKPLRLGESDLHAATYQRLGIPILGRIEAPGTVDGGDALWLDQQTLAVGRGYRTNEAGIAQLGDLLAPHGVSVLPVALPHWRGPAECLHLMSMISPVAPGLAVVYLPLLATSFVELLRERGWQFVEVPDEEFDSLGCNVLALGSRRAVAAAGNPITRERLEAAGCEVLTYDGGEISLNRAGGPTCLTRPLLRATG
jgi:dimethylargininase